MLEENKRTPEEKIRFLEYQIMQLKHDLASAIRERDEAIYKKEVAEWAVVGIVRSRIRVQVSESGKQVNDLLMLTDAIGRNTAMRLLHAADLAFKAHAEMHEMRQHIYYMEQHAGARGVQFTPWRRIPN